LSGSLIIPFAVFNVRSKAISFDLQIHPAMKTFICLLLLIPSLTTVAQRKKSGDGLTLQRADSLFTASDWKGALPVYEHVLKNDPENGIAWNRLGFCYHNLKNYRDALASYSKALACNPDETQKQRIYSYMAMSYSVQHEIEKSFHSLGLALDHGYMLAGELERHEDFATLRADERFSGIVRKATENAMPCMTNGQLRQFDFWLGTWDVYPNGSERMAGESRIEMASGGCMILENWTSMGLAPFGGKSMNYINPGTGKWEQLWVGSDGVNPNNPQKFVNGEYRDGAMRFEFEQWSADGKKQTGRFIFYNEGPNQVRQFNEVSSNGGKTWTTVYDFIYKRKL